MSKIKGKDTGPEIKLRKALWAEGFRYRINYKLPGKPDIVFPGKRIVIFVDGCFWHCCPLHGAKPKTNREFWNKKLKKNKERDNKINRKLNEMGWKVLRFWEHQIKNNLKEVTEGIQQTINNRT